MVPSMLSTACTLGSQLVAISSVDPFTLDSSRMEKTPSSSMSSMMANTTVMIFPLILRLMNHVMGVSCDD